MSKSFYEKYYQDQPRLTKGIINVIVVGGVAFAAWKIYEAIKKRSDTGDDRANVQNFKTDLAALAARGIYPSFTASQYSSWANEIEEAFEGCDPINASSFAILAILKKLKNDADFVSLMIAWGVRDYDDCGWGTVSGDLFTAVNSELNFLDRGSCNIVLRDRGITYRF